jgi:hypothetical protein
MSSTRLRLITEPDLPVFVLQLLHVCMHACVQACACVHVCVRFSLPVPQDVRILLASNPISSPTTTGPMPIVITLQCINHHNFARCLPRYWLRLSSTIRKMLSLGSNTTFALHKPQGRKNGVCCDKRRCQLSKPVKTWFLSRTVPNRHNAVHMTPLICKHLTTSTCSINSLQPRPSDQPARARSNYMTFYPCCP